MSEHNLTPKQVFDRMQEIMMNHCTVPFGNRKIKFHSKAYEKEYDELYKIHMNRNTHEQAK